MFLYLKMFLLYIYVLSCGTYKSAQASQGRSFNGKTYIYYMKYIGAKTLLLKFKSPNHLGTWPQRMMFSCTWSFHVFSRPFGMVVFTIIWLNDSRTTFSGTCEGLGEQRWKKQRQARAENAHNTDLLRWLCMNSTGESIPNTARNDNGCNNFG